MKLGGTGETVAIYAPNVGGATSTAPSADTWTNGSEIIQPDGTIGRLEIPKVGLNVPVYEGEDLSNLAKGTGHFDETSAWRGNVGIAGHNRGTNAYFGQIHTLENGDIITYSTSLGKRNYAVFNVVQVNEYDVSCLNPSAEDIITLVTCVRDVPSLRWVVQARAT
jgi:sortase A